MQRDPRTARWLPFVTFLAGVVLTSSAVVLLDAARGQEREGDRPTDPRRPSAPPDPRLPGDAIVPEPEGPLPGPAPATNDLADETEGVGVEALYKSIFQWSDQEVDIPDDPGPIPPIEELLRERYAITGKFLEVATTRFNDPPRAGHPHDIGARLVPVLELSRERLELRLRLAKSREEQVRVLIRELAYTKKVLENLETMTRGGALSPSDLRAPRLYRLELETRLAELAGQ